MPLDSPADRPKAIDAGALPFVREVDERFHSFQIGMSHLTGGETWRTYDENAEEGRLVARASKPFAKSAPQ